MEEENLFDINELYKNSTEPSSLSTPYSKDGVVGFNTGVNDSKYDENFLAHLHDANGGFGEALQRHRAGHQPTSHKLGNALGRLTNIIPEAIGSVASALDFEDYANTNDEVGNWLTDITEQWKQGTNKSLPIYRDNPGKALDFGDEGWWIENGSALVQSIGGFAIGGGTITKGLSGLSKLTKARKLATKIAGFNKGAKIADGAKTVLTAGMLNQAEAVLEASQVYDEIYQKTLTELNGQGIKDADNQAKQKAADAASATIAANRVNILLNLSSASLFTKAPKLTRNILKKETFKSNAKLGLIEGSQESAEEIINYLAGNYGRAVGEDKDYDFNTIMKDLGKPEAIEAALLGFMGGLGQTIVTKEGVNRFNKFTDPNTGEKVSIKDYNRRAYDTQQELISQYDSQAKSSDAKTFTDAFNSITDNVKLYEGYKKAIDEGDDAKAEEFRQLTLNNQAYNAFTNGTTGNLIKLYEDLRNGEQKEGMDKDYKQRASEAINKIESLEKIYNKSSKYNNSQEIYINRAHNNDLTNKYDEVDSQINESLSDLQKQVNILTDGTEFTGESDKFTFDVHNLEFNPAIASLSGNDNATKQFKALQALTKRLPEYQEWIALKDAKNTIKNRLSENNEDYIKISSPEYQSEFKSKQDVARQNTSKKMDEQVKAAEKEIKNDEEVVRRQDIQNKRDKINKNAKDKNIAAKNKRDTTNSALSNKGDKFNIGEKTTLNDISEEHAGQVGTITDVKIKGDGTNSVTIETEDGEIITTEESSTIDKSDVKNTEGSEVLTTSNEDSIKDSQHKDIEDNNSKNKSKLTEVKLMSTSAYFASDLKTNSTFKTSDDKVLPGIPQAFLDYERNGAKKDGTKITFDINTDINLKTAKSAIFKNAIKLLDKAKSGEELSKNDKNLIVDYLPIKVKVNDSNEIYTFLMSKPNTDNKDALQAYNNRSRSLRIAIVKALIDGNDIKSLSTTIKGQYGGQLNLAPKGTENNVLDLQGIDGDIAKAPLYVIDAFGSMIDFSGNKVNTFGKPRPNWKGAVYTKIKKANGDDFYLSLNNGKVTTNQANAIFDIFEAVSTGEYAPAALLSTLPEKVAKSIKKNLKPELNLFQKIDDRSFNEVSISELLDLIYWDGSETSKSKLKINFTTGAVTAGDINYTSGTLNSDSKKEFVDWVINNKNRNFKLKPKQNDALRTLNASNIDYLKYAFDTKLVTTDVNTKESNFKGFTNLYINNAISGVTKIKVKPKEKVNVVNSSFNPSKDTEMRFAMIDGVNYHASLSTGRAFNEKVLNLKPNEIPTLKERIGDIITDNDLIAKIEASLKSNPFVPSPNASLKRYDKKSEEKALNSQEKVVSLQDNTLEETATKVEKPKRGKKMSRKERAERARNSQNNKLNKNCKH